MAPPYAKTKKNEAGDIGSKAVVVVEGTALDV